MSIGIFIMNSVTNNNTISVFFRNETPGHIDCGLADIETREVQWTPIWNYSTEKNKTDIKYEKVVFLRIPELSVKISSNSLSSAVRNITSLQFPIPL